MTRQVSIAAVCAVMGLAWSVQSAGATDPLIASSYNLYGVPGLLEMPTAEMAVDGEVAGTYSRVATQQRTTLTFQLAPRLTGTFRYARIPGFNDNGTDRFDRSFDLRFHLLDEGRYLPAVAIGLQDFIGTGVYSGEYIVATKSITDRIRVTGGLGWGRLGGANQIIDGFGERTGEFTQTGGVANFGQLFRGPIGAFGGVTWDVNDKLTFKAEYSSDAYVVETRNGVYDADSPWNFGVNYEFALGANFQAAYLNGNELAVGINFVLNPDKRVWGPGNETAPLPVFQRPSRKSAPEIYGTGWTVDGGESINLRETIKATLNDAGVKVEAIALDAKSAELRIDNKIYNAQTQAIGRSARALTRILPASIETITLVPVSDGVPNSAITLRRSDIEAYENSTGNAILNRAVVTSGARPLNPNLRYEPEAYPRVDWSITPYSEVSLFDPDQPVRGDVGLQVSLDVDLAPGLVFTGAVRKKVLGNLDQITRKSNSVLPRVRSEFARYLKEGDPRIEVLQMAYYSRPGKDLYARITAGYLERMYAGVSAEVLWKPVDSRLALGAELAHVRQRDFEGGFGLLDYEVTTGHVSAYYDLKNGFHATLDVGRYLAGDLGATIGLDREFANGWKIGAYATFTDVPFEEFGEGSFDKGLRLHIPFDYFTGSPTRTYYTTILQPLTRDGGARLKVGGRLYGRVRDSHTPILEERAGRFWK